MRSAASELWTPWFCPCHTLRITGCSTGTNKVIRKPFYLPQLFSLIHHVKLIAIRPVFLWSPLTLCFSLDPQIKLTQDLITTLLYRGKAPIRAHYWMIQSPTVISEAKTLWTSHFQTCRALRLTGYSTSTNKMIGKPVDLTQWFGLLHCVNWIDKRLVFWWSPLTKSLICLQGNSIYIWNYYESEDKYDKCIHKKKYVMRTIHWIKPISNKTVFLCTLLNFCFILLSSN